MAKDTIEQKETIKVRMLENVSLEGKVMYAGLVYDVEKEQAEAFITSSRALRA